jgi:hypothetical protein
VFRQNTTTTFFCPLFVLCHLSFVIRYWGLDHRFGHSEGDEIPVRAFANFAPLRLREKPDRVDEFLAKAQRRKVRNDSSQAAQFLSDSRNDDQTSNGE